MAEVDTAMLAGQHADIRREQAVGFGDTRYNIAERTGDIRRELADAKDVLNDAIRVEGGSTRAQNAAETGNIISETLKGDAHTVDVVKDSRYEIVSRVESNADRIERQISEASARTADRFFAISHELAEVHQGQATLAKDVELNALKGIIEGQKNTQYLSDRIASEGEKTRMLINDHKYHDLNRNLVERNAELVHCDTDRRHYRDRYWDSRQDQWGSQFAAMQNQLQSMNQNFNSQLSETRQGMVNFGTMAGVGQTSSANNVR